MTDSLPPLQTLWLCETVRLRESKQAYSKDSEACRKARATPGPLALRLQVRGLFLAQRDGLLIAMQHWLQGEIGTLAVKFQRTYCWCAPG